MFGPWINMSEEFPAVLFTGTRHNMKSTHYLLHSKLFLIIYFTNNYYYVLTWELNGSNNDGAANPGNLQAQ